MQLKKAGFWNKSHNSFKDITTISVGGKIENFIEIKNPKELVNFIANNSDYILIGGGSNVLFSDNIFSKPVLRYDDSYCDTKGNEIVAGAGGLLQDLIDTTIKQGKSGFEYLSGIPGSVGGAIVQNSGAYGYETSTYVKTVEVLNTDTKKIEIFSKKDCHFDYRSSIFKNNSKYIVLSASFVLPDKTVPIIFNELKGKIQESDSLDNKAKKIIEIRKVKGAIFDPNDKQTYSSGSFFKNPVIDSPIDGIQFYNFGEKYKLYAAELIEKSRIPKGFRINNSGAKVSNFNTLLLVNDKSCKAADIIELQKYIQDKVYDKFAVKLVPEVVFVNG